MRYIDMETWSRRNHFKLFSNFNHPHFSMCVNMDVTAFYPFTRRNRYSFTVAMVYLIARTSNAIPEFKQRIRENQVVEHEIVHPGFSILVDENLFGFCHVEYTEDFSEFLTRAAKSIENLKADNDQLHAPETDDALYMSPIPWVSFTSFNHPMRFHPADSVPRFAWGKWFKDNDGLKMPLNIQGHHAVMDGIHMGRFYEKIQDFLHHPEAVLGGAAK